MIAPTDLFYAVHVMSTHWSVGELAAGQELSTKHPSYTGETIAEVCAQCDATPDMWEIE